MVAPSQPAVQVTDVRALRALAHPLRNRLLGLLRVDGPSTATLLGQRVGESSGATSYHLRQLAAYGFVADMPEQGSGRERWWRALHRSTSWSTSDFVDDPGGREVADELQHRLLEQRSRLYSAWSAQREVLQDQWGRAATFNDLAMRLTPEQATRLAEDLIAVVVRWRDEEQAPPGTEGTELVQVLADVFPLKDYPL